MAVLRLLAPFRPSDLHSWGKFNWREQLRTPKYAQSKRNLEKGWISILSKEKACLIRKGLTMEL